MTMQSPVLEAHRFGPRNGFEFDVRLYSFGVYVCQRYDGEGQAKVEQSSVFPDKTSFAKWCDAALVRHAEPLLQESLKRCVDDLFEVLRRSST